MASNNSINNQALNGFTASGGNINISADAASATVNVGTGASPKVTNIGSSNTTSQTSVNGGTLGVTMNSGTGAIFIGSDATTSTVAVANGAGNKSLFLGSNAAGSTTSVLSESGGMTFASNTGNMNFIAGTGTISMANDIDNNSINIATGSANKTLTMGSVNSVSATAIRSGSGGLALSANVGQITMNSGGGIISISGDAAANSINIGNAAAIKTVVVGSGNSTSQTTIQSGTGPLGLLTANGAVTVTTGTGTVTVSGDATANTVNIASGAGNKTLFLGSTNTTSTTTMRSGSGGIVINNSSNPINIGTDTGSNTISIATGPGSRSLNMGNAATQTIHLGAINLGSYTGANQRFLTVDAVGDLGTFANPLPPATGGTGTSTVFAAGSVPFIGASGVYNQNNAQFFWDNTNARLGIGTTTPFTPLTVVRTTGALAVDPLVRVTGTKTTMVYTSDNDNPTFAFSRTGGVSGTFGSVFFTFDNGGGAGALNNVFNFSGAVSITGALSKGSGTFTIDHPLDPYNKLLQHSFIESPDMMNIYNGNVALDADGTATITMPDWFSALNMDFKYQLTCIGGFAPVYISHKWNGTNFRIAGGYEALEVSWQITGIRNDRFAQANRIQVEVTKETPHYRHPDLWRD